MRIITSKRIATLISASFVAVAVSTAFASQSQQASEPAVVIRMSKIERREDIATTTSTSTTTTTIAPEVLMEQQAREILARPYAWGEHSDNVVQLQFIVGVTVDGVYGKATRSAHLAALRSREMSEVGVPPVPPTEQSYGDKQCPQWETLAISVGWPAEQIEKLSNIIYRESTCREASHNTSDPTWAGSRGLMQINGYWCIPNKYNPIGWLQEQGILDDCDDLFDPETNLRAGLAIWQRGGWGAWSTA